MKQLLVEIGCKVQYLTLTRVKVKKRMVDELTRTGEYGTVVGVVNCRMPDGEHTLHASVVTDGDAPRQDLKLFKLLECMGPSNVDEAMARLELHKLSMAHMNAGVPYTVPELWFKIELIVYGCGRPMTASKEKLPKEFLVFLREEVERSKDRYIEATFKKNYPLRGELLKRACGVASQKSGVR